PVGVFQASSRMKAVPAVAAGDVVHDPPPPAPLDAEAIAVPLLDGAAGDERIPAVVQVSGPQAKNPGGRGPPRPGDREELNRDARLVLGVQGREEMAHIRLAVRVIRMRQRLIELDGTVLDSSDDGMTGSPAELLAVADGDLHAGPEPARVGNLDRG